MTNPIPDPVSTYLDVQRRMEDEDYGALEMSQDLAHILLACRALIQHNSLLSAQVLSANTLVDEQTIEIFTKDLEIHELHQKLAEGQDEF